jgi:hypothetical protein
MPSTRELLLKSHTPLARLQVCFPLIFAKSSDQDLTNFVHASPFKGPVKTANLTMLGYTVPNQAYSALLWFSWCLVLIALVSQSR